MTDTELREALFERRQWTHRPGDRYFAVVNDPEGPGVVPVVGPYTAQSTARGAAATLVGHDDFHIAVVRDGGVVAVIWAMRLVDTDAEVLELVSEGLVL